jgi:ABC-type glycerol-3-phosphate transport system substrate-binding protein
MKKILSALLVTVLILTAAACGGGGGGSEAATENPTTPTQGPASTTPGPGTPTAPGGEPGDVVVEQGSWMERWLAQDENERTYYDENGNFQHALLMQRWTPVDQGGAELMWSGTGMMREPNEGEIFGLGIMYDQLDQKHMIYERWNIGSVNNFTGGNQADNYEHLVVSSLAGDPNADIYYVGGGHIPAAAARNLIMPFSEFVPANADIWHDAHFLRRGAHMFGDYWSANHTSSEVTMVYGPFLCVNIDLIHEVGTPDPRDLYDAGQWTWDAFENLARDVKNFSSEARPVWALAGDNANMIGNFIASNGGRIYDHENDVMAIDAPEAMAAINFFYRMLMHERVIFVFGEEGINHGANALIYQGGDIALFEVVVWRLFQRDQATGLGFTGLPFEIGVVSYPFGPSNKGATSFYSYAGMIFPAVNRTPEQNMVTYKIWEEYHSWPGDDLDKIYYMHRDKWTDIMSGRCFERLLEIADNQQTFDMFHVFRGWMFQGLLTDIYENGRTAAQAVEENLQIIYEVVATAIGLIGGAD